MDPSAPQRRNRLPFLISAVASIVAIAAIGFILYQKIQTPVTRQIDSNNQVSQAMTGLTAPVVNKLSSAYQDADGNLLADPPAADKQLDPDTLFISYVASENPEQFRDGFKELLDHVAQATGKKVQYQLIHETDEELKDLQGGTIQIAAFGTGTVPLAVDACGFIPMCRVGGQSDEGAGNHMLIIVPATSAMTQLSDLKGHELGVTEPSSNSGYKAALVMLKDAALLPGRDFTLRFSGGQETSIGHISDGSYEAAAVASDVLDRAVADGRIAKSGYRILYTSELFPTAAFGYAYNLKPALAAKIKAAFLDFNWKDTGLEQLFGPSGATKFVPVNYKDDWALIRRIDDTIGDAHVLK